jgi:hypothetical protein
MVLRLMLMLWLGMIEDKAVGKIRRLDGTDR